MKKLALITLAALAGLTSFAQSKKDLEVIIAKRNKSIDSLIAIVENQENIIENRDRSNKILTDDKNELYDLWQEEIALRKQKEQKIADLNKELSTGKPKIMYMSNTKNVLRVPEGTFWTLHQFMSDFSGGTTTDSTGAKIVEEVHVFLKEINGTVLTDPTKNLYGPKLFSSLHPEQMIRFPIMFTAGTQFKIVVLKGSIGSLTPYEGKVYCTYTEKED